MLTVLTILAVIMGFSIGFLKRGQSEFDLMRAALRDQVRLAHTTAKSRGLPTEVTVEPARQNEAAFVQARVLAPVGHWHFEPGERVLDSALQPRFSGKQEPAGRFGQAMRPDPDSQLSLLLVNAGGNAAWDLRSGFALRLDLKLDSRSPCTVAKLGRALTLTLDSAAVPEAKITLADPGPKPGVVITATARQGLRLAEWTTVEVVHDGKELMLLVDGRREASVRARGGVYQDNRDVFEVSAANAKIPGAVDEVQMLAYQPADRVDFPPDATIGGLQKTIAFDRRGELVEPIELELVLVDRREKVRIGEGGILQ
jgi:hypothetical protein